MPKCGTKTPMSPDMVKSKQPRQTQQEKSRRPVQSFRKISEPIIHQTSAGQGDSPQPQVCVLGGQHALKKKGRRRRQHSSRKLDKQLLEIFAMLVVLW
ncbi:hypothetical protein BDR04DRAFT_1101196 [Suillus decipiens]|nr:hypothetical protein BDR04DRAFT_1101196 [Suillus decipiens]